MPSQPKSFNYSIERKKYFARKPLIVGQQQFLEREVAIITVTWSDGYFFAGEISPLPGLSTESLDESITWAHQLLQELKFLTWDLKIPSEQIQLEKEFFGFYYPVKQCPASTLLALEWIFLNRISNVVINKPLEHLFLGPDWYLNSGIEGIVKIKIAKLPPAEEINLLQNFINNNPHTMLRLDANQALDLDQWSQYLKSISQNRIDYWEEPIKAHLWNNLPEEFLKIPVGFDEILLPYSQNATIPEFPLKPKNIIIRPSCSRGISGVITLIHWAQKQQIGVTITSSYEGVKGMDALYWLGQYANRSQICHCGTNTLGQFI